MFKFLILFVTSFFITQLFNHFFGDKSADIKEGKTVIFKVTSDAGIVGCLSKEKFKEAAELYAKKDFSRVQKMVDEEICFIFKKGEELEASENTCSSEDSDDKLYPFKPMKFAILQPYLPCFAVR